MLDAGQVKYHRNYDTYYICDIVYCNEHHFIVFPFFSREKNDEGYKITRKAMDYNQCYTVYNLAMRLCLAHLCVLS